VGRGDGRDAAALDDGERVHRRVDAMGVSMRRAAFGLALERVAEAIAARGLFP
jgi:hypothetical protein